MTHTFEQKWELDSLYPSEERQEMIETEILGIKEKIKRVLNGIRSQERENQTDSLPSLLLELQQAYSEWYQIDDFLYCAYAENVLDDAVKNLMNESAMVKSELESCQFQLDQVLAKITPHEWNELRNHKELQPFSFYLEERRKAVSDRLAPEMEQLINALSVNGFTAWEMHHEEMLNRLLIPLTLEGKSVEVPIQEAWHYAMFAPTREARKEAASGIEKVCGENTEVFASVFNRIAGYRLELYKQRGWDKLLKEAFEQNRIEEKSLESMMAAIEESRSMIKSYLERKFRLEKIERPAWYDLDAPSFATEEKVSYQGAAEIIISQFKAFHPELGEFAKDAFDNGWIESEDRPNKAGGGFCASFPLAKESRIFVTFRGSYQDVVTIAHELGHAYHNYVLQEEPFFAQQKGTSVAETASTFMENMVMDAAIERAENDREKLALLEMKISNAIKYIGTIPNMFRFEQKFYEQRKNGLVAPGEIKRLLAETESELYGGLLEELDEHRWMYVAHFYDTEKAFYNIPYTIGYLFSNGIYVKSKGKGPEFFAEYTELLRNSGRMTIEQLAAHYLKEDATEMPFWQSSIETARAAIEEYLRLTERYVETQ